MTSTPLPEALGHDMVVYALSFVSELPDYLSVTKTSRGMARAAAQSRMLCGKRSVSLLLAPIQILFVSKKPPPFLFYADGGVHNADLITAIHEWRPNRLSVCLQRSWCEPPRDVVAECVRLSRFVRVAFPDSKVVGSLQVELPRSLSGVLLGYFGNDLTALKIRIDGDNAMGQLIALFHHVRANTTLEVLCIEVRFEDLGVLVSEMERRLPQLPPSIKNVCMGGCEARLVGHMLESADFPDQAMPHSVCGLRARTITAALRCATEMFLRYPTLRHVVVALPVIEYDDHDTRSPQIDADSDGPMMLHALQRISAAVKNSAGGSCTTLTCGHHRDGLERRRAYEAQIQQVSHQYAAAASVQPPSVVTGQPLQAGQPLESEQPPSSSAAAVSVQPASAVRGQPFQPSSARVPWREYYSFNYATPTSKFPSVRPPYGSYVAGSTTSSATGWDALLPSVQPPSVVTGQPLQAGQPLESEQPPSSSAAAVSVQPPSVVTGQPLQAGQPLESEQPPSSSAAAVSVQPPSVVTGQPLQAGQPLESEQPPSSSAAAVSVQPPSVVTGQPLQAGQPLESEQPPSSSAAAVSVQPPSVVTGQPLQAGQPLESEQPPSSSAAAALTPPAAAVTNRTIVIVASDGVETEATVSDDRLSLTVTVLAAFLCPLRQRQEYTECV